MNRITIAAVLACGVALSAPAYADSLVPAGRCVQLVDCTQVEAGVLYVSAPAGDGPAAAPDAPADAVVEGPVPSFMAEEPPDLADRFQELQAAYDALKAARAGADPVAERIALWGILGALTMLLLAGLKFLDEKYSNNPRLKRYLPWVALAVAFASGLFDALVVGGGALQAMYTATGPVLAVLMHELKEGWTGDRALAHARAATNKPRRK